MCKRVKYLCYNLFFGFYFLFFLLIFILSHIGEDVSSTDTPTASVSEQLQSVPNRPKLKKIKRPVARVERGRFVINEIDLY